MIIKLPNALQEDYVPELVSHREKEIGEIVAMLRTFFVRGIPQNVFIYGPTGVGKTLCSRYLCTKAYEELSGVDYIFINCWENSTRISILTKIADHFKLLLPRRGIAVDEVFVRIEETINKKKKKFVVVLDEVDRLIASKYSKDSALYDLIKLGKSNMMLIMISNLEKLPYMIDERIKSVLALKYIQFQRYNVFQLKEIVRERADIALFPNTYDAEVVGLIGAIASGRGDARVAISLLREAALEAERRDSRQITVDDVYAAKDRLIEFKHRDYQNMEREIINVLMERGTVSAGELYMILAGYEQRTIRNWLRLLCKTGLVKASRQKKGKGWTTYYELDKERI